MKGRFFKALNPARNLLSAAVIISVLFWFLEAAVHSFIFKAGTYAQEVFTLDFNEIWMRFLIAGLLVSFGGYAQYLMEKRKALELELMRERDLSMTYFDLAKVIMLVLDTGGNIVQINKKGYEALGCGPGDVVGKNWFDNFIPEQARTRVKGVFEDLMTGAKDMAEGYENPVLTKTGNERVISWHNTVLKDEKGAVIGTISSGVDETERILMNARLRERIDELERFTKITIGREIKMKELRDRIKELERRFEKGMISKQ